MSPATPRPGRALDVGLGVLLLGVCSSGYLVSLGGLTSRNLFETPLAIRVFNLHGALASVALCVALLLAHVGRPISHWGARIAASVMVLAAIFFAVALVLFAKASDFRLDSYSPVLSLFFGALQSTASLAVIALAVRSIREGAWTATEVTLVLSGVAALLSGVGVFALHASLSRAAFELLLVACLARLCELEPAEKGARPLLVPFVALAALVALASVLRNVGSQLSEYDRTALSSSYMLGVFFIPYVCVRAWRAFPKVFESAHAATCARWAVTLLAPSILLRLFLGALSIDIHLHDTLFASGTAHLEFFFILLTWLTLWLRMREPRPGAAWALRLGLLSIGFGAHFTCWTMVIMGSQGMPMRYTRYLEQFTTLHRASTLGATIFLAGLLITLCSIVPRREPLPPLHDVFA